MAKIEIPTHLERLLKGSPFLPPILTLLERTSEFLSNNPPFFPYYTDHGIEHITSVLKSETELVPSTVWEESNESSHPRLLCDADAAVIIGSTLLHDVAMHLHPKGFLELIDKDSRFQPLPWFKENQEDHLADQPWVELWDYYDREARRLSDCDLSNIIGEESAKKWKFQGLPTNPGQWQENDRLIIGEFIRRHHARLAHEIAIYGLPGVPAGWGNHQYPALGTNGNHPLHNLADLIGLAARSHWLSLRTCKSYMDATPLYQGTPRPFGTAILYTMSLLRVADYLQIDNERAPAVLLQLRNPQSPMSVQEWKKHRAVQHIGPADDPGGKMITVSPETSLKIYLQLRELLTGLQTEIDHSTAILNEFYETRKDLGLDKLKLATKRIYSNLQKPAFLGKLPYVPEHTGFSADPNILSILVGPLYGEHPCFGIRELMQNAVDAVCELESWCSNRGITAHSLDLAELDDSDVLIEFIKQGSDIWLLRVRDKGIGMTADIIQNYFLRAGASYRENPEWAREHLDAHGIARVARSGRFGVGVFAVFLLGHSFRMWTRHAGADKSKGYKVVATASSHLIEIQRLEVQHIGTIIEIELSEKSSEALGLIRHDPYGGQRHIHSSMTWLEKDCLDWFCWDWPKVTTQIVNGNKIEKCRKEFTFPLHKEKLPPEWAVIYPKGFEGGVFWTFTPNCPPSPPKLSCNGLKIAGFHFPFHDKTVTNTDYPWPEEIPLAPPCIAVRDGAGNLPLTVQRDKLSQAKLPFIDDLARDVIISYIAHSLVCGPKNYSEALSEHNKHPLAMTQRPLPTTNQSTFREKSPFANAQLRWCVTAERMVPADPWLHTLLNTQTLLIYGILSSTNSKTSSHFITPTIITPYITKDLSCLSWSVDRQYFNKQHINSGQIIDVRQPSQAEILFFQYITQHDLSVLELAIDSTHVLISTSITFESDRLVKKHHHRSTTPHNYTNTTNAHTQRKWFKAKIGKASNSIDLDSVLLSLESSLCINPTDRDIIYISEIITKEPKHIPKSLLACVWHECLGAKAIPFDQKSREELIAEGCKHNELKRHIDAWLEMKQTNSVWTKGKLVKGHESSNIGWCYK